MPEKKDNYKPLDWEGYNASLCQRGSLTLWLEEGVYRQWRDACQHGKVVGQKFYPDVVITLCLTIKQVYHLALRQSTGFIASIFSLMGLTDLVVPDYSTLCRRGAALSIKVNRRLAGKKLHIAVDSTGLKVFGEGEWKVRKHGAGKHRTWRKLHLSIDVANQKILSCELSKNSVDDAAMVEELLGPVAGKVEKCYADGAYDSKKARKAIRQAGGKAVVPPPKNAVKSKEDRPELKERDQALERIADLGRKEWKKQSGYHKRSLAETAMYRYKTIIGDTLSARKIENQLTEVRIGCHILNRFQAIGLAKSVIT